MTLKHSKKVFLSGTVHFACSSSHSKCAVVAKKEPTARQDAKRTTGHHQAKAKAIRTIVKFRAVKRTSTGRCDQCSAKASV